jgi:hypothetical protein
MTPELTLQEEAASVSLFAKVADAVRAMETSEDVRQVIASEARGEIVVIGHDYSHVALTVAA